MLRFTLLLFSILLCGNLFAQNGTAVVYGTVIDQENKPLENLYVYVSGVNDAVATDKLGNYQLSVPANKPLQIVYSYLNSLRDTVNLQLKPGERYLIDKKFDTEIVLGGVDIKGERHMVEDEVREKVSTVKIDVKDIEQLPAPTQDIVSAVLLKGVGVSIKSELSSQYTVRGGNFDENLVYVNGFEVYRPFLIRSGQQEGLSFINSSMVEDLLFSAGGFEAKYGDKMASVLAAEYKQPDSLGGSVSMGLLGGFAHLEGAIRNKKGEKKFTFLMGVRHKQNQYLLNSLETQGQYSPSFTDVQGFFTYRFNKKWSLEYITNYARNRYVFVPVDRETTFGVVNQVLRLTMYFDGREADSYQTLMNGLSLVFEPKDNLKLKFMGSLYNSSEIEAYDILGEYFIGEVENDLGDEEFGQVRFSLGVGGIQDHARNRLDWMIGNAEHQGIWTKGNHEVSWGLKYQREMIDDKLNEWQRIDSAGYSLPYSTDEVQINYVLKSTFSMNSNRYSGYLQDTWKISSVPNVTFNYGVRFSYWDVNKEWLISPRFQFSFKPRFSDKLVFNLAGGMYQQPPFYREMRNLDGVVNTNLKAQKSLQAIFGIDYNFKMWGRKFKLISEVYYKYLYDMVPYEFDNVLIRYFGTNDAIGYATGFDVRLNGEFVPDNDSYISFSVMKTEEDLKSDNSYTYFDADGNEVGPANPNVASVEVGTPGRIPRPTDQRFMLNMFFQDNIPNFEIFRVHLNLIFASGLPFGPPDSERYKDVLRIPPYRRVDIGFSAALFDQANRIKKNKPVKKVMRQVKSIWLTFEVYNILGINNTVSYLWVKDINNTSYAVPNYLSSRLFNLRFVAKF